MKIAVVGGGAAGMMAAAAAAGRGAEVSVFEKNEKLGKKLFITGKGRCNLTNSCDNADFFGNVISNPKFLYSAIYGFDQESVRAFFEDNGCALKEERGGRIFPVSDHSSDVIKTLEGVLKKRNVQIYLNTRIGFIRKTDEGFVLGTEGRELNFDRVILACGGPAYPSTGADMKGYSLAENLGHTKTGLYPALVPLEVAEAEECRALMGLSLKNVSLCMKSGKKIYEGFGEMLYTHFGLSGPLVLSASSVYSGRYEGKETKLYIDLKPALSHEQLDKRILRDFEENMNRQFKNVLRLLLPGKMAEIFPARVGIAGDKYIREITKAERERLVSVLKSLEYNVTGTRGFEESIITKGGIKVKEVDPATMGSRIVKGLYIAGEMLDVDALTGGYNLQIAWATGHAAGVAAAEEVWE